MTAGDAVYLRLKRGTVEDTPIGKAISAEASAMNMILIGPGTGIAPMRAIVQHHQHRAASLPAAKDLSVASSSPQLLVFFGCRKRAQDYLYGEEWDAINAAADSSAGVRVEVAFSQDQAAKDYVTHSIRRQGAAVWRMIDQGACVFVSGSAKQMPADVKKALLAVFAEHGGHSAAQSQEVLNFLVRSKRLVVEAWS